jgi:hypothetical protein
MMTSVVRLHTAARIRLRATRPPASAAASSFSERVFARYLRRGAVQRMLELLLSMRSPLFVQNVLQRCGVEVTAPSIVLLARERNPPQSFVPARAPHRRLSVAAAAKRWARLANERAAASFALLHLVERAARREAVPSGSATPAELASRAFVAARSAGDGAGTLPVVGRSIDAQSIRKLIEQNETRARDAKLEPSLPGDSRERHTSTQPRRPGVEFDIEHLADRVISSIDRRIVAQRERLGRN